MVDNSLRLDDIFGSLADATRRGILQRVAKTELCIGDLAEPYNMSLAAISKHIGVLEKAKLIVKRRAGKQQFVQLAPAAVQEASAYLKEYERLWNNRLDSLEQYLSTLPSSSHGKGK